MKHHLRLLAAFAVVLLGFAPLVPAQTVAGAPTTIDYQGKALDSVGSPLANTTPTNFEMRFRIYDAQEGGTVIWSEKQIVTVSKGLFSVRLGEGTALSRAEGSVAQTALADAVAVAYNAKLDDNAMYPILNGDYSTVGTAKWTAAEL